MRMRLMSAIYALCAALLMTIGVFDTTPAEAGYRGSYHRAGFYRGGYRGVAVRHVGYRGFYGGRGFYRGGLYRGYGYRGYGYRGYGVVRTGFYGGGYYGGGYAPAYYGYGYAPAYYGGYTSSYYAPAYYPRYRRVIRPAFAYYGGPRYHRWHHRGHRW